MLTLIIWKVNGVPLSAEITLWKIKAVVQSEFQNDPTTPKLECAQIMKTSKTTQKFSTGVLTNMLSKYFTPMGNANRSQF